MKRILGFAIAVLVGLAAGLAYGWMLNPARYDNTSPDTLRLDYKTDYVLMVAETYQAEKSPDQAAQRLALLGSHPPADLAQQAVLWADQAGYAPADLKRMTDLAAALKAWKASAPPEAAP